ncbi:hypothetical protein ABEB36_001387 [Hypothenemus hampei]|uniref:C2H2-type domain-containing protein n=1 Tax=Hypothenemus hampei TaxID=57062 RepID=A0ABD1FED8_HYPHA
MPRRYCASFKKLLEISNTTTYANILLKFFSRLSRIIPLKELLCNICGRTVRNLKKHLDLHQFECPECLTTFKSLQLLQDHQKIHLKNNQLSCTYCPLKFSTNFDLCLHVYKHVKRYICPICGFKSSNKTSGSIKFHIRRHENNFNFRCNICGKGFVGSKKLQDHLEIHTGVPKYECEVCSKKFTVKNYLNLHVRYNHKKEVFGIEEGFQCEVCGRKFTFEKSLIRHLSVIHKIGKNLQVECQICGKLLANNFNLKMHMKVHTGEKDFSCEKCGKGFSHLKH